MYHGYPGLDLTWAMCKHLIAINKLQIAIILSEFKHTFFVIVRLLHPMKPIYRGRIAPTPTGYLHMGHAQTFWIAKERARKASGKLVYRCEDLDPGRCKPEFARAAMDDLRWFGCDWDEGPDIGGPFAPYCQSERMSLFLNAWKQLKDAGFITPAISHARMLPMRHRRRMKTLKTANQFIRRTYARLLARAKQRHHQVILIGAFACPIIVQLNSMI